MVGTIIIFFNLRDIKKIVTVQEILDTKHSLMNDIVMGTSSGLEAAYFEVRLNELIKERGITQKDLSQMTGLRVGTISEMVHGKGNSLNKVQLVSVMVALHITDMNEIIRLVVPEPKKTEFDNEATAWEETKEIPESMKELYKENVLKASGLSK